MSFAKINKNAQKESDRFHKEQMERVVPVARKLLKLIAEHADRLTLGDDGQLGEESFIKLTEDALNLFLQESKTSAFRVMDRNLVWDVATQALSIPREHANQSLTRGIQEVMTATIGKPYEELELHELDTYFKDAAKARLEYQQKTEKPAKTKPKK